MKKIGLIALAVLAAVVLGACRAPWQSQVPTAEQIKACREGVEKVDDWKCDEVIFLAEEVEAARGDVGECPETVTAPAKCPTPARPTARSTATPVRPTATPVRPTATPVPPAVTETLCFLVGGRQLDGGTGGNGFEYVAVADCTYLEQGTGLQPYFSMTVRSGFDDSVGVPPQLEVLNDGVQGVVIVEDGQWVFYGIPRNDGAGVVPFWSLSWIRYNGGSFHLCSDDTSGPGDWSGDCGGITQNLGWKVPLDQLSQYADFVPYIAPLQAAMSTASPPFNDRIEIVTTFRN